MSKGFSYSKWDNIELSDDEDDVHPNIDRESWFRLKHRSRVEREEQEAADRKRILEEMGASDLRIQEIRKKLGDIESKQRQQQKHGKDNNVNGSNDDDDDDFEDKDGLYAELEELQAANKSRSDKLMAYERHKKWNVDNMCHVVDEKTVVNKNNAERDYSQDTGFALPSKEERERLQRLAEEEDQKRRQVDVEGKVEVCDIKTDETTSGDTATTAASRKGDLNLSQATASTSSTSSAQPEKKSKAVADKVAAGPKDKHDSTSISMLSYVDFTDRYGDTMEQFMALQSMDHSKEFLLQHGSVLLQENASSYLLLASLEDEMNGYHDKMKLTARQSQILTNIAELAKTLKAHPGNVIMPFFRRMDEPEYLNSFVEGVNHFVEKVKARAVVKKKEIDAENAASAVQEEEEEYVQTDLKSIPKEDRLGPGGLDPVEVFESLPVKLQEAFESREVEALKEALMDLSPEDAEYHMKRCVDSGLWTEGG